MVPIPGLWGFDVYLEIACGVFLLEGIWVF